LFAQWTSAVDAVACCPVAQYPDGPPDVVEGGIDSIDRGGGGQLRFYAGFFRRIGSGAYRVDRKTRKNRRENRVVAGTFGSGSAGSRGGGGPGGIPQCAGKI